MKKRERKTQKIQLVSVGDQWVLARSLAAGQTLYRLMGNRLGPLQVVLSTNPSSEGLADHSTGGLMLHHPGHAQVIGTRQAIWRLKVTHE